MRQGKIRDQSLNKLAPAEQYDPCQHPVALSGWDYWFLCGNHNCDHPCLAAKPAPIHVAELVGGLWITRGWRASGAVQKSRGSSLSLS